MIKKHIERVVVLEMIKSYVLRITLRNKENCYREIRIDGFYTLHELSVEIEKGFEFLSSSNQYMFSTDQKLYDPNGYYHHSFMACTARDAGKTSLDSLDLKENDRLLYIYDFGNNYIFDILVTEIINKDLKSLPALLASEGCVYVYANDPEECMAFVKGRCIKPYSFRTEIDRYNMSRFFHFHASGSHVMHLAHTFLGEDHDCNIDEESVSIELSNAVKADPSKLFRLIYPEAFAFLRDIYLGNVSAGRVDNKLFQHIVLICSLGLIDVAIEPADDSDRLVLYIPKDYEEFIPFLSDSEFDKTIQERVDLDNALNMILDLYGVIEEDKLVELIEDMFGLNVDHDTFYDDILFPRLVELSAYVILGDKVNYISRYTVDEVFRIFSSRDKLDGLGYKIFSKYEAEILKTEGIRGIIKGYYEFAQQHTKHFNYEINDIMDAFDRVLAFRAKGNNIDDAQELMSYKLGINWQDVTPEVKRMFTNIMNECPMHTYRGYSYKEALHLSNK